MLKLVLVLHKACRYLDQLIKQLNWSDEVVILDAKLATPERIKWIPGRSRFLVLDTNGNKILKSDETGQMTKAQPLNLKKEDQLIQQWKPANQHKILTYAI